MREYWWAGYEAIFLLQMNMLKHTSAKNTKMTI